MYLGIEVQEVPGATHDLALIFLLLRLRRRTRFFLHLALIFVDGSKLWKGSVIEQRQGLMPAKPLGGRGALTLLRR